MSETKTIVTKNGLVTTKQLAQDLGTYPKVILESGRKCFPNKEIKRGISTYWSIEEATAILEQLKASNPNQNTFTAAVKLVNTDLTPQYKRMQAFKMIEESIALEQENLKKENISLKREIIEKDRTLKRQEKFIYSLKNCIKLIRKGKYFMPRPFLKEDFEAAKEAFKNISVPENEHILRNKIKYYDNLVLRNHLTNFEDTAYQLGMETLDFTNTLLEDGYLEYSHNSKLRPKEEYILNKKYFVLRDYSTNQGTGTQVLITVEGKEHFFNRYGKVEDSMIFDNLVPIVFDPKIEEREEEKKDVFEALEEEKIDVYEALDRYENRQ